MPSTQKKRSTENFNIVKIVKNGLYSLQKFIAANGSLDLLSLFTENKKQGVDDLLSKTSRQTDSKVNIQSKDLLAIIGGWFTDKNKGDPENFIRENILGLFSFITKDILELRIKLDLNKKNNTQQIINKLEEFEKKISNLTNEETFLYINLYIFVRWDNIISLRRFKEIQNIFHLEKIDPLNQGNYEILKNKTAYLDLQRANSDLNFSNLASIKSWSKVKQIILTELNHFKNNSSDPVSSSIFESDASSNSTLSNTEDKKPILNTNSATNKSGLQNIDTVILHPELENKNQDTTSLLEKEKTELEEKCQSLERLKTNLETQLEAVKKNEVLNSTFKQKYTSNKEQLDKLKIDLNGLRENLTKKETALTDLKHDHERNLANLKDAHEEKAGLKMDLQNKQDAFEESKNRKEQLEKLNVELNKKIEKVDEELKIKTDALINKSIELQASLKRQEFYQEDLDYKKNVETQLFGEINNLNTELILIKEKLKNVENENLLSKEKNAELNEVVQEKKIKVNQLTANKSNIETLLNVKSDEYQAISIKHSKLKTELQKKDNSLQEQEQTLERTTHDLKENIQLVNQFREKIKIKDIQIKEHQKKFTALNTVLEEKQSKYQQTNEQFHMLKQRLETIGNSDKAARDKLAENELEINELRKKIQEISSLNKGNEEKFKLLNVKLHLEEKKNERLKADLTSFTANSSSFIRAMQNKLNELNVNKTSSSETIYAISHNESPYFISFPTDEEDDTHISIDGAMFDNLNRQIISNFEHLKDQNRKSENLLEIKEKEIENLCNQYKSLEKADNTVKKSLKSQIDNLENQLSELQLHNNELLQAITPKNYSYDGDWDDMDQGIHADKEKIESLERQIESLGFLLKNTQAETQQKSIEFLLERENFEATLSTLKSENKSLSEELNKIQEDKKNVEEEIGSLKDALQKNDSTNKTNLASISQQLSELDNLRDKLKEKDKNINQLEEEQKQHENKLSFLNQNLENLEAKLQRTTDDLKQANEILVQSQKTSNEFSKENNKLIIYIENLEKTSSVLQKECDTLQESSNNIQEIQNQLETSQQEIENLNKEINFFENKTQSLEEELQELKRKEHSMPARYTQSNEKASFGTRLTVPKQNLDSLNHYSFNYPEQQPRSSSTSSTTSSPDHTPRSSLENLNLFPYPSCAIHNTSQRSSSDYLNNAHTLAGSGSEKHQHLIGPDELTISITTPLGNPRLPIEQQIESLFLEPVKNRFKQELVVLLIKHYKTAFNPPPYLENELDNFKQRVENTVSDLLDNGSAQTEIKAAITQLYFQKIVALSPENAAKELLDLFKSNTDASMPLAYPKCYEIFQNILKHITYGVQHYFTLLNLSKQHFLTKDLENQLLDHTYNKLVPYLVNIDENPQSNKEIENITIGIVADIFTPENVFEALEKAETKAESNENNLVEIAKNSLFEQCDETIKNIFEKINMSEVLPDIKIQEIPLELQYANSKKEFISGLRIKYPHLSTDCENKINEDNFKNLRFLLRKKTLETFNKTLPEDKDIIDLDTAAWLEKKLSLVTNKPINLEQIRLQKEQRNLLNELSSSLELSKLYDIAITPKSTSELTKEIEKSNQTQLSIADQLNKIFAEIEIMQKNYPNLIDNNDIPGFTANLNQHLENNSITLKITDEEAKILLIAINRRLKKDISKWDLLNNSFQKEITNDIHVNLQQNNFNFDKVDIEKAVTHALSVLRENYPNDTLKKREQWLKAIGLLYATTKELSHFSQNIETNIAKFENLHALKKADGSVQEKTETKAQVTGAVYLPHSCTIISNSFDSNLTEELFSDFKVLDGAFYKQDALKPKQKLTFAQTLHNGEEQKWSVTRIDETCLAYQTHKPWLNIVNNIKDGISNTMTYVKSNNSKEFRGHEEVIYTQLTHAVNSTKSPICTITIGKNCSKEKEKFIRLVVDKFNQQQRQSGKKTILMNANDKLKIHADDKATTYNKIDKAHSFTENLNIQAKQTSETLKSHGLTR